jgi:Uma2 family endonuclease
MEVTSLDQLDLNKVYSYADYLTWKFPERVELFRGKIYAMSPAPASGHQRILGKVGNSLYNFLDKSECEVFYAPFDVRLESKKDNTKNFTVVQPDISVICDPAKIEKRGCLGAPDLVVEILSPGNTDKEMKLKFDLYEGSGVLEYWIVEPTEKIVLVYNLVNGQFVNHRPLIHSDTLCSKVLTGFELDLSKVF